MQQTFRGEIIEIGAVKIDEDANVLDTFSIHLRPRIFRKLQHHIAKVTGLTQADLDRGEPIVQGLRRFMKWCGPDAEFAEWGMDDVPVLKQNLFLCNLDESRPTVWYDLQQVFLREHPRKEGEGMTLESVVTRMGIPMDRPFHAALSDISVARCPVCGEDLTPDEIWLKKGSNSWYTLAQCPRCQGSGNEAGKGVLQRYKLARRDGLHWSFARCVQVPDDAGLARWHKQRTQQIERMRARAEKQAEEAAKNAAK